MKILVEENSREIIQSACRSIGSIKPNEFDVRFNPDLFQPFVTLNQTVVFASIFSEVSRKKFRCFQSEETASDVQILKEAAEFLVLKQIPAMVQDFQDHTSVPVDGFALSETMHSR